MLKVRVSPAMAVTLLCVLAMAFFVACSGAGAGIPASEGASKVAELASDSELTVDAVSKALASAEPAIADSGAMPEVLALADKVIEDPEVLSEVKALADKVMEDPGPMNLVQEAMLAAEAAATVDSGVVDSMEDVLSSSGAAALVDNVVPAPDSAPALVTTYEEFGFGLGLDLGADVRAAGGSEDTQGAINFTIGSVNTIMTWVPEQDSSPLSMASGTYDVLQSNQAGISFESIAAGEISVNGQPGVFLGFRSLDEAGDTLGGGLIGAWTCADSGRAFTLTLTSADATTLQIRFDRILENFTCAA